MEDIQVSPKEFDDIGGFNAARKLSFEDDFALDYCGITFRVDPDAYQRYKLQQLVDRNILREETLIKLQTL